ncbi:MAG TPA: arginine deiminase family protein [Candidatus Krumholzibacteria bacterium]|nr:arginine deiminase family protein [Candidatus Krumholzibacteria bacterium]
MLDVRSEVGRLREVLVHAPGPEVDRMVPDMMEELLFDDILFGERAREEHERFRRLLGAVDVRVHDMRDLLVEALAAEGARSWLLNAMLDDVSSPVGERMQASSPSDLVDMFVAGVRFTEGSDVLSSEELFEVVPVPNWCFQRDPQVVVADSVLFSAMATLTRTREVLLARTVFRFHPDLAATPVLHDPLEASPDRPLYIGMHQPRIEGGDVMVLSEDVAVIGYSERTNRSGVRHVVRALTRMENGPRWLIVASLPQKRAYMHLDTVMTQIDAGSCLAFPPVILPGHDDTASVYEFDLHEKDPRPRPASDMLTALRGRGVDLEAVPCGGDDPLEQQREQWTDGANALALAPGVIVLYERNVATAECLAGRGYRVVEADDVIAGRVPVDLDRPEPTCILLPSHELSRARGGPHCLSHALRRDRIR